MIKFFRSIRKTLLIEGKSRNYLKYAVGEIVLVMIGILLALQVNNWNQNRLNKEYEQKMLHELVEDLKLDTTYLNVQFKRIDRFEASGDLILNDPQNMKDNPDIFLFGGVYFIQNSKTIETIKSGDLQIPFDDNLRNQINSQYHRSQFLLDLLTIEDKNFTEFRSIPLQKSQFKIVRNLNSEDFDINFVPIDYDATINSTEFNDYLLLRKSKIIRWKWAYNSILDNTIKCIDSITLYLDKSK